MAAHQLGRMQEFEPDTESISAYLERLQMFFEANDIAAEKKVSVLLTVIGKQNFSLLRNLVAPATPKDKSFDDLTALLKTHFEPKKLVIAERFNFYRRDQHDGESIMDFVADLRRLTLNCEFERASGFSGNGRKRKRKRKRKRTRKGSSRRFTLWYRSTIL